MAKKSKTLITLDVVEKALQDRTVKNALKRYVNGDKTFLPFASTTLMSKLGMLGFAPQIVYQVAKSKTATLEKLLKTNNEIDGVSLLYVNYVQGAIREARHKVTGKPRGLTLYINMQRPSPERTVLISLTRDVIIAWEGLREELGADFYPDFSQFCDRFFYHVITHIGRNNYRINKITPSVQQKAIEYLYLELQMESDPDFSLCMEMIRYYVRLTDRSSVNFVDNLQVRIAFYEAKLQLQEVIQGYEDLQYSEKLNYHKMWVDAQYQVFITGSNCNDLALELGYINGAKSLNRFVEYNNAK